MYRLVHHDIPIPLSTPLDLQSAVREWLEFVGVDHQIETILPLVEVDILLHQQGEISFSQAPKGILNSVLIHPIQEHLILPFSVYEFRYCPCHLFSFYRINNILIFFISISRCSQYLLSFYPVLVGNTAVSVVVEIVPISSLYIEFISYDRVND